jgi:hypothetical protein
MPWVPSARGSTLKILKMEFSDKTLRQRPMVRGSALEMELRELLPPTSLVV